MGIKDKQTYGENYWALEVEAQTLSEELTEKEVDGKEKPVVDGGKLTEEFYSRVMETVRGELGIKTVQPDTETGDKIEVDEDSMVKHTIYFP